MVYFLKIMCIKVFPSPHVCAFDVCAWCSGRPEEDTGFSGLRVTHGCEPPCRC